MYKQDLWVVTVGWKTVNWDEQQKGWIFYFEDTNKVPHPPNYNELFKQIEEHGWRFVEEVVCECDERYFFGTIKLSYRDYLQEKLMRDYVLSIARNMDSNEYGVWKKKNKEYFDKKTGKVTGGKYINTTTFFFRINEQDEITDITFMQKDRKKLIQSKNDLEEIINYGKDTSEHITIADELFVNYEANTKSSNYY